MNAKILIAAATLAVGLASLALAQDDVQHPRGQQSVNPSYGLYKSNPSQGLHKSGVYFGSDPNPTIRALMLGGNGSDGDW
jgi:hypothetical protein